MVTENSNFMLQYVENPAQICKWDYRCYISVTSKRVQIYTKTCCAVDLQRKATRISLHFQCRYRRPVLCACMAEKKWKSIIGKCKNWQLVSVIQRLKVFLTRHKNPHLESSSNWAEQKTSRQLHTFTAEPWSCVPAVLATVYSTEVEGLPLGVFTCS